MSHVLVTAATIWPVSLNAAKNHLQVLHSEDDAFIYNTSEAALGVVQLATRFLERRWGACFLSQSWKLLLDDWKDERYWRDEYDAIFIPRPPLSSVTSITYYDSDGDQQTWASSNYQVDTNSKPGRVALASGKSFPTLQYDRKLENITINHTSGFASVTALNQQWPGVTQAIRLLMAHWYEHPEAVLIGTISRELDFSLNAIEEQYNFATWI